MTWQALARSSQYPFSMPSRQRRHSPTAHREHGSVQQNQGPTQTPESLLWQHGVLQRQSPVEAQNSWRSQR
jgi:hypothetical protein